VTSIWSTIKQALLGRRVDYTDETLERAVVLLAVPMVLEMVGEAIFALADAYWVSSLGADAVAAVGMTEAMMTVIYALAMGLSMSAAAVVARRVGAKEPDRAASAAVQAILLGLILAAVLGILGALLGPKLLGLMGGRPDLIETGSGFTRVMLGGNVTVVLIFLINAVFRGAGDAAIAMRTLFLANFLNIVLGPCFIFGLGPFPRLGVTGAAVATTIGRGIGVLYQLRQLIRGRGKLVIARRHVVVDPPVLLGIVRMGANAAAQSLISTTSWIGLVRLLAGFGSAVVAGYTLAIRVVMFAILPAWGLANASATLVGQNLGAAKPDRAERAVWIAARYDLFFLGGIGLLFFIAPHAIIGLFQADAEVTAIGARALRIIAVGFPLYAYAIVVVSAFNGAGDTRVPTLINAFCFWLWEIPIGWALAYGFGLDESGMFVAITIAFSTMAVIGVVVFRKGRWKEKVV
jgi:putative MATE family efflux protein